MPMLQTLEPVSTFSSIQKKYAEDRSVITTQEMHAHLVRNHTHIHWLVKALTGIIDRAPPEVYGLLSDIFQYLEINRLYDVSVQGNKPFYHERNLHNVYRSREEMRYFYSESFSSSRRWPGLEHVKLSNAKDCLNAEPTAERFLHFLRTTTNRISRHIAMLIKDASDNRVLHYQYNAYVDVITGVRDGNSTALLNPIFSEQYFGLLPEGPNRKIFVEAVALGRRYGAVRAMIETNSIGELVDYAQDLADLLPEMEYQPLREQYAELMTQRATPNAATFNFYDYEKRHRDHYDGRNILVPVAGPEIRQLAFRKEPIAGPGDQQAVFYLTLGRETNNLVQRLVDTMERIRSFSMLQTTYERFRQQNDQDEGFVVEGDS